jgi:hypothetical protein
MTRAAAWLVGLAAVVGALCAGCLSGDEAHEGLAGRDRNALAPGLDHRAFEATQARELDLVSDRADPSHLSLAYIVPRVDPAFPSWLAFAKSRDAGQTWETSMLCGDPLEPELPDDLACPFHRARLTSDPVLLQLHDGAFLYVGVALHATEVALFAARFAPEALEPEWITLVARSAFDFFEGAQQLPAPYMAYYNGKPNVMQDSSDALHIAWAADLGADVDPPGNTGLPFWTTSLDGGQTWSMPSSLVPQTFTDAGSMYAVGIEAFETVDGALHAVWWDSRSNTLLQVTSSDGGATFTPPRAFASVVGRTRDAPVDSNNLTRIWTGVDRSGGPWHGSVYLLADDKSDGQRDLVLLVSRDNGASWSSPVTPQGLPRDNGRDETMARLLVEPNGAVSILYPSWHDRERWSDSDMHLARSVDGGATFTSVQLSSEPNPFDNPGDYNDLDVVPGGVLAVWEDSRGGAPGERWAWTSTITVT